MEVYLLKCFIKNDECLHVIGIFSNKEKAIMAAKKENVFNPKIHKVNIDEIFFQYWND